jgi:hypothetical protein
MGYVKKKKTNMLKDIHKKEERRRHSPSLKNLKKDRGENHAKEEFIPHPPHTHRYTS